MKRKYPAASTSKYWTIQSLSAWEQAQQTGFLEGHIDHISYPEAYHWMMDQMTERLPFYDGSYPVWVWKEKPDLLQLNHFTGREQCVCLTLSLHPLNVLLSDFQEWHSVLNNTFNAVDHIEWEEFRTGCSTLTKEQSWLRIFDLDRLKHEEDRRLQGVTGRVRLQQVLKAEYLVEPSLAKRYYYC
ncbi:DUF3841 domain-containing protein [Paenibacillus bovis]|uniref:DUF3841 domain-containing protein n=1 Tax=Paenibacillus bovis TaxID=1616788 RepID=A0A172ZKJ0_9BACL|nr:DUF3841 domain-containing protein [Paenibacillus bovis]ANF97660.1 hypothetical protein AR543_17690 [Paenibacillus bovis]